MSKGRERRERLRAETERLNAVRKLITDAQEMTDLLAEIPMFKKFDRNGLKCNVTAYTSCPEELRDWVFELTARHMREFYEKTWGWSDKNKRRELFEPEARYLIATLEDGKNIGFIHIRFELDQGAPILYVYELQVEDEYQRKGLGRFLMQAAEFIALKRKMEAVLLTVFKENIGSRQFYYNMKYQPHSTSPDPNDPEEDHEILFKPLVKSK